MRNRIIQIKRTVDFVICGTQKGGTSALDAYLRGHPEICMAGKKEVHFFDNEEIFSSGKPDYSKYLSSFNPKKSHKILGEATPIYMYWNDSPKRIWEYNPNMKLIVLLRNPIERAYSHWNMDCSIHSDSLPFWETIQKEKSRSDEALPQDRRYSYIDRGFYLKQLRRLWTYFPIDRIFIMKNEDLRQKPVETLNRVCEFLGVKNMKSIVEMNVHSRPYTSSLNEKERDYLRFIFEDEIKELEIELNWDCREWLL